jgi:hypothetical protein
VTALPPDFTDWTLETISELIVRTEYEDDRFDFKGALSDRDDRELARMIARCASAMANGDGGFMIFGVRDRGNVDEKDAKNPEARIVGIPMRDDHAKQFGDKVARIQPTIDFRPARSIPLDSKDGAVIFVVEIAASPRRPHQHEGVFYIRGDGGAARPMDYYEVRDQMLWTESLQQQVRLARLKLRQWEDRAIALTELDAPVLRSFYGRFDTDAFDILLANVCVAFPADSRLLDALLAVSAKAQEMNERLVRWRFNDFEGHQIMTMVEPAAAWRDEVHAEARLIAERCNACSRDLAELFGPLGQSTIGQELAQGGDESEASRERST